jgi:peptidoglycan/xylan/chitin deacetylase (PgdA/CDA1 family)
MHGRARSQLPARSGPVPAIPARRVPARRVPARGVPAGAALARALLAGGAAFAVAQGAPGLTALAPVRRLFPGLAGAGAPDHVALTFDDGPDPRCTPRFLATLAARGVRATFFLLGPMVQAAPQLAAEIAAAGHEIGVHGWEHRYATVRGPRALRDDLARACDTIAAATGTVPRLYRPPYGVLSAGALIAARRLGLRPILWSTWGREWTPGATPVSVQATLARTLGGGATVLLHDSDCTAPPGTAVAALGALPWLLDECARRGLRAGPLAEHLADGPRPG